MRKLYFLLVGKAVLDDTRHSFIVLRCVSARQEHANAGIPSMGKAVAEKILHPTQPLELFDGITHHIKAGIDVH